MSRTSRSLPLCWDASSWSCWFSHLILLWFNARTVRSKRLSTGCHSGSAARLASPHEDPAWKKERVQKGSNVCLCCRSPWVERAKTGRDK
ncbi:hypothetical protein DER45DRAFT_264015 [Fusarium avenaceum]|nr:hypothetical protein DER45DRAFT_264015 [Fusarium avenaceum]